MVKGLMAFLPTAQYSITPVLQGRDFQEFFATLKSPFLVIVPFFLNAFNQPSRFSRKFRCIQLRVFLLNPKKLFFLML